MDYSNQLIIGYGEIGRGLHAVLSQTFVRVDHRDEEEDLEHAGNLSYELLHVCYPWSSSFVSATRTYIRNYKPKLVIIHSTVPVGTTKKCGSICVHSPVRGRHPHLAEGIKKFVKFIGAQNFDTLEDTICFYNTAGITWYRCHNAESSELLKLVCTTYYGWNIVFEKEVRKLCKKYSASFLDVYHASNVTYNDGYQALKEPQFTRPNLAHIPGPIGGHCVIPNCQILKDWDVAQFILEKNKAYEEDTAF